MVIWRAGRGMARALLIFGSCLLCALILLDARVAAAPVAPLATHPSDTQNRQPVSSQQNNSHERSDPAVSFNRLKRSATPASSHDDYPDYLLGVKYDEYPMIVPEKRAALLIDRLMVALQKAIEDEEGRGMGRRTKNYSSHSEDGMDLQRRGHQIVSGQKNGRYWRCYFNAVTCF